MRRICDQFERETSRVAKHCHYFQSAVDAIGTHIYLRVDRKEDLVCTCGALKTKKEICTCGAFTCRHEVTQAREFAEFCIETVERQGNPLSKSDAEILRKQWKKFLK